MSVQMLALYDEDGTCIGFTEERLGYLFPNNRGEYNGERWEVDDVSTEDWDGEQVMVAHLKRYKVQPGWKWCEACECYRPDVSYDVNPFAAAIYGDYSLMYICRECANNRAMDI